MTCQFDYDVQCHENCPDCSQYKLHCKKCGDEIDDLTYDGLCFECYIGKQYDDGLMLKDFVESYPEIMVKFFKRKCCKYVLASDTYEFRDVIIVIVAYYPFCSV